MARPFSTFPKGLLSIALTTWYLIYLLEYFKEKNKSL